MANAKAEWIGSGDTPTISMTTFNRVSARRLEAGSFNTKGLPMIFLPDVNEESALEDRRVLWTEESP